MNSATKASGSMMPVIVYRNTFLQVPLEDHAISPIFHPLAAPHVLAVVASTSSFATPAHMNEC